MYYYMLRIILCLVPVQVVPLKENGAELDVTEENKMEYLDLLAQHKLAKCVKEEIDAFLKGIYWYMCTVP